MLRRAVGDLDEPRAKEVIATLSDCYRPVAAETARRVLASLHYAVRPWSEGAGLVANLLHAGDVDGAYEQLTINAA
jgi:hypothetical protein